MPVIKNAEDLRPARARPRDRRPRRPCPSKKLMPDDVPGRDLHDHEPRRLRRVQRHADHQPAAGGDPRHLRDREAPVGRATTSWARRDRHPPADVPHADLRPPPRRWRLRARFLRDLSATSRPGDAYSVSDRGARLRRQPWRLPLDLPGLSRTTRRSRCSDSARGAPSRSARSRHGDPARASARRDPRRAVPTRRRAPPAGRRTTSRSSRPTAAASRPTTARASSSAIRSSTSPARPRPEAYVARPRVGHHRHARGIRARGDAATTGSPASGSAGGRAGPRRSRPSACTSRAG